MKTDLIVALDFSDASRASQLVDQIEASGNLSVIYKVGLELFSSAGPDFVQKLTSKGKRVFLDLKLHDIPHTVEKAVTQLGQLGVEMLTIHLAGGKEMCEAALGAAKSFGEQPPRVLGVSVLTSFSEESWEQIVSQISKNPKKVAESAFNLVSEFYQTALQDKQGVVCSAQELQTLRKKFPSLYTVVPGIRPASGEGSQKSDQKRVATPAQAHEWGASAIVVGRPITQAADPVAVVQKILSEIGN